MYKTLEQQILKLWKSRGIEVETIEFGIKNKKAVWTITAPVEKCHIKKH